jgi:2'-5' RNA ligase
MYTNRFVIVALVPEPYQEQLGAMRKQYDIFCRQWLPPHVTIVPPFDLDLTRDEKTRLKQISVPTTSSFEGWGAYQRKFTSVLFQKLTDHSFDDLKIAVYDAVPMLPPQPVDDPTYHVTVVSRIPNEQFEPLQAEVSKNEVKGSFTVDTVTVYSWDDNVRQWLEVT